MYIVIFFAKINVANKNPYIFILLVKNIETDEMPNGHPSKDNQSIQKIEMDEPGLRLEGPITKLRFKFSRALSEKLKHELSFNDEGKRGSYKLRRL